jgi:AGCS family alanine or glycine:cation symporter
MVFYNFLDSTMASLSSALWSMPLVILLLGGGIFFSLYSRLTPLLYFRHAIQVLMGKYDSKDAPGQITHFEALSSALAGTVGMGNIAGVAVAIHTGGPGAVFWMWVTAVLGMSTKFFTCTLALMYRGYDDQGEIQGGVMYYIEEGLGKNIVF